MTRPGDAVAMACRPGALAKAGDMTVICLNGWGGRRFEALQAYPRVEGPDVLCPQETVHSPATDLDGLTCHDCDHVLPKRASFFRNVQRLLPGHAASFCAAAWRVDDLSPGGGAEVRRDHQPRGIRSLSAGAGSPARVPLPVG